MIQFPQRAGRGEAAPKSPSRALSQNQFAGLLYNPRVRICGKARGGMKRPEESGRDGILQSKHLKFTEQNKTRAAAGFAPERVTGDAGAAGGSVRLWGSGGRPDESRAAEGLAERGGAAKSAARSGETCGVPLWGFQPPGSGCASGGDFHLIPRRPLSGRGSFPRRPTASFGP